MNSVSEAATSSFDRVRQAFASGADQGTAKMNELTEKSEEGARKIGEQFTQMRESVMHFIEVVGLLEGVRIFKETIAETLEMGEKLKNMSIETGISTSHLQELQFAAAATGVDFERLTRFVGQMTRALVTMSSGSSRNYQMVLEAAGLRPSDLADSYTGILKISEAIQRLGENSVQARALLTTFGVRGGLQLAPMFAELEELTAKAREMGLVMSQEVVEQLDKSREAFNVLGFVVQVDKERIAAALTPVLQTLASMLTEVAEHVNVLAQTGHPAGLGADGG